MIKVLRAGFTSGRSCRRRGHLKLVTLILAIAIVSAATARLFVWPDQGMPAHVDAIVMLNGTGNRLDSALELGWHHRAPIIVISRGSTFWGSGSKCAPAIPREKIICFDPAPSTTKGEAEFVGRLAKQYGWRSLVLVTSTPQDSRARLRVERCFAGPVYAETVHLPLSSWPYEIAYEWGATIKAVAFQRAC